MRTIVSKEMAAWERYWRLPQRQPNVWYESYNIASIQQAPAIVQAEGELLYEDYLPIGWMDPTGAEDTGVIMTLRRKGHVSIS